MSLDTGYSTAVGSGGHPDHIVAERSSPLILLSLLDSKALARRGGQRQADRVRLVPTPMRSATSSEHIRPEHPVVFVVVNRAGCCRRVIVALNSSRPQHTVGRGRSAVDVVRARRPDSYGARELQRRLGAPGLGFRRGARLALPLQWYPAPQSDGSRRGSNPRFAATEGGATKRRYQFAQGLMAGLLGHDELPRAAVNALAEIHWNDPLAPIIDDSR